MLHTGRNALGAGNLVDRPHADALVVKAHRGQTTIGHDIAQTIVNTHHTHVLGHAPPARLEPANTRHHVGGTSGLLANALAKAAKERGINLETAAEAYGNHVDMLPDFDLVVLAPQTASYLADLQKDRERVGNKCVACRGKQYIELSQNGNKSLAFVSEQLSK